jgi:hypothetical protein
MPYVIPGPKTKDDAARVLVIHPIKQTEWGPWNGNRVRQRLDHNVTPDEIARCIILEWTNWGQYMTPDGCPGVWIVREYLSVMVDDGNGGWRQGVDEDHNLLVRPASDIERQAMWDEDEAAARQRTALYADKLVARADKIHVNPMASVGTDISEVMRAAALFRGYDAPWLYKHTGAMLTTCPYCTKSLNPLAIVCEHCHQVANPERWAEQKAREERILAAKRAAIESQELERLTAPTVGKHSTKQTQPAA